MGRGRHSLGSSGREERRLEVMWEVEVCQQLFTNQQESVLIY